MHKLEYINGTSDNNNLVQCSCGWAYSGTNSSIHERGKVHCEVFKNEPYKWNDTRRTAVMPAINHYGQKVIT